MWLLLMGAPAAAQETPLAAPQQGTSQRTSQQAPPGTILPEGTQQPTAEAPTPTIEQPPIVPATPFPTPPGAIQAAPDQTGNILPGFGFPFGGNPNLTGTGITPFSLGGLVTGTGILPYQQFAGPSPTAFQVSQNLRFNDNVQFVPQGGRTPPGLQKGDWIETTTATVSPSMYVGEQILFAHATYGLTRYRQDTQLDSNFFNADAGVNWKFGQLCTGQGRVAASQNQVPFQEQTTFAIQTATVGSVVENARCRLTGHLSATIDGSYANNTISGGNTQFNSSANSNKAQQIGGGLEYLLPGLDTVRTQATFTGTNFTNRPTAVVASSGLASSTNLSLYQLIYHRDLTPKLKFDGNLGFNQINVVSPGSATADVSGWSYGASLLYLATPKLIFQLTSAQGVGPPLAVLANFQLTRTNSISVNYRYSARLNFHAALAQATTINSTSRFSGSLGTGTGINPAAGTLQTRTVEIGASYKVSPFMSAFAVYNYFDSKNAQLGTTTLSNVYLVGLSWQH
jgi:hypothetical protein